VPLFSSLLESKAADQFASQPQAAAPSARIRTRMHADLGGVPSAPAGTRAAGPIMPSAPSRTGLGHPQVTARRWPGRRLRPGRARPRSQWVLARGPVQIPSADTPGTPRRRERPARQPKPFD
jgi:hypothetical protein